MYCQQCKLDIKGTDLSECPLCSSALLPDSGAKSDAPEKQAPQKTFTSIEGSPEPDKPEDPASESAPPHELSSPATPGAAAPGSSAEESFPIDLSMPESEPALELDTEPKTAVSPEESEDTTAEAGAEELMFEPEPDTLLELDTEPKMAVSPEESEDTAPEADEEDLLFDPEPDTLLEPDTEATTALNPEDTEDTASEADEEDLLFDPEPEPLLEPDTEATSALSPEESEETAPEAYEEDLLFDPEPDTEPPGTAEAEESPPPPAPEEFPIDLSMPEPDAEPPAAAFKDTPAEAEAEDLLLDPPGPVSESSREPDIEPSTMDLALEPPDGPAEDDFPMDLPLPEPDAFSEPSPAPESMAAPLGAGLLPDSVPSLTLESASQTPDGTPELNLESPEGYLQYQQETSSLEASPASKGRRKTDPSRRERVLSEALEQFRGLERPAESANPEQKNSLRHLGTAARLTVFLFLGGVAVLFFLRPVSLPHLSVKSLEIPLAKKPGQILKGILKPTPEAPAAKPAVRQPNRAKKPPVPKVLYSVHAGSYRREKNARKEVQAMKRQGFEAYLDAAKVKGKGTWYRVKVGKFKTRSEAKKTWQTLQQRLNRSDLRIVRLLPK